MLYRRGKYWYARFTAKGIRVNRSTGRTEKAEAEKVESRWREQILNQSQLDEIPPHSWQEAVDSWYRTKQHKRSLDDDLQKLTWLKKHFNGKLVTQIDTPLIERTLDKKPNISNATRNRYYSVIRGVLKRAHFLGWIATMPAIEMRPEKRSTPRHLTHDQAQALLACLNTERRQHLHDMVLFSLATGARESNVTGLRWNRINLAQKYAYVRAEGFKGKRSYRMPLNSTALSVLESRAGLHKTHVFSYRGNPVRHANRDGFQAARKEAGLDWLRWHDLRHTWASWHVMAGTPLRVLKELGGWKTLDMVMRYAHLAPDFADKYAENVAQNVTHSGSEETLKIA